MSQFIEYENLVNYKKYKEPSLIKQLSDKPAIKKNNLGDICVREYPHCESPSMYELFKDETLIELEIKLEEYHIKLFGDQIKNIENFNTIKIRGQESLINAFMKQKPDENKVNIFINSIRSIPITNLLHDFTNLKDQEFIINEKIQKIIDNYGKELPDGALSELPMTQQYCNWYEYFNPTTKEDYYKYFVVIVTNENLYHEYRKLYPHFIIITQPNTSFQCVGLTRHTELMIAFHLKLKKIACIDDNIINIQMPNFNYDDASGTDYYNAYYLKKLTVLEQIFQLNEINLTNLNGQKEEIKVNFDEYGYLGTTNGFSSYNKNADWVKNSFEKEYFKDYLLNEIKSIESDTKIMKDTDTIVNNNIYFRDYINMPHDISEIPSSDTADLSFLNPHRLKFIIINVENMMKHNISYLPLHTMAEDLYFTREILKKGLKTCQISLNITAAKDSRRPVTCSTEGCSKEEQYYNLLDGNAKTTTEQTFPFRSDLITYKGGLLFFNDKGILGSGGAFGPAKLITKDIKLDYNDYVDTKIREDQEINNGDKETCKKKFNSQEATYKFDSNVSNVHYVNPSKYKEKLYENKDGEIILKYKKSATERYGNSNENTVTNYFLNTIENITDSTIRYSYINNFANTYKKWFDIVSVSEKNILSSSTGMHKYVREYEYENILSFKYFTDFYEKSKDKINKVYKIINCLLEDKNKDKCNRKNDILFYLENYNVIPDIIFILLSLYIIFSKIKGFENQIIPLITTGNKKFLNLSFLLFGNINDAIYINDNVKKSITNIYNNIMKITQKIDIEQNMKNIWTEYEKIVKQYIN